MTNVLQNRVKARLNRVEEASSTSNKFTIGADYAGVLTREFKQAISVWETIAQTREGQRELIEAGIERETDAINYILYRGNAMIHKAYSSYAKSFDKGNYVDDFQGFVSEVLLLMKSEKSPLDTFDMDKVDEKFDLLKACIIWCGRYFTTLSQRLENNDLKGGVSGHGSGAPGSKKAVRVSNSSFDEDNSDSGNYSITQDSDGGYVSTSGYNGSDSSGVAFKRPTEQSGLSAESMETLKIWKNFCNDSVLYDGEKISSGYKVFSVAGVMKDILRGKRVRNQKYADEIGFSLGTAVNRANSAQRTLKTYFNSNTKTGIDLEDLKELKDELGAEKLISYFRKED